MKLKYIAIGSFLLILNFHLPVAWSQNLLVNGDFSGGNTGFTTGYSYSPSGQSAAVGTYGVRTTSLDFNSGYVSFNDHTTGSGKMMLVDGSSGPNTVVWSETVPVSAGTQYIFSGWVTSSDSANVPVLRFFINAVQVTPDLTLSTSSGQWQQFAIPWNSGFSSSAVLSIVDENLVALGNDFAMDDLFFAPVPNMSVSASGFTYQGRLNSGTNFANGSFDLTFTLYTTNVGGSPVAGPAVNSGVPVNNGLFTTMIDFGPGAFNSGGTWLEIGVRTNGSGSFTTLLPRQPLTPTPYAITAENVAGLNVQQNPGGAPNFIGGSSNSVASGTTGAFIGSGTQNQIGTSDTDSVIAGGALNMIQTNALYSMIGGGYQNVIQTNSYYSVIAGGLQNTILNDAGISTISGGQLNTIQNSASATIGGGALNTIQSGCPDATIGGGVQNTIQLSGAYSTIGGGQQNTIQTSVDRAVIGGGVGNAIQTGGGYSTISGGSGNTIQAFGSAIGGGSGNTIQSNAVFSTIGGGNGNTVSGYNGTVPGGQANVAGTNSLAAGYRAKARHFGSFVWADSTEADFATTTNNQFLIRASGGVGIGKANPATALDVAGTITCVTLNQTSDRNAKENFRPVNAQQVLTRVSSLPITEWNYKSDSKGVQHLGPVAQDFRAAFGLNGSDDSHIAVVDEGGVALAAIQGLNEKLEVRSQKLEAENAALKARNDSLEKRLARLEELIETGSAEAK